MFAIVIDIPVVFHNGNSLLLLHLPLILDIDDYLNLLLGRDIGGNASDAGFKDSGHVHVKELGDVLIVVRFSTFVYQSI